MSFENVRPYDPKSKIVNVVIETPKGSRNKYAYDPATQTIALRRILPLGMSFPFDFGFIPQTTAGDGDPLDALVLMDEPAFPGCLVPCRLLGVIIATQTERRKTTRNDRLVAVPQKSVMYASVKTLADLHRGIVDQIGEFFVTYHALQGRTFRAKRNDGPDSALQLIASTCRASD